MNGCNEPDNQSILDIKKEEPDDDDSTVINTINENSFVYECHPSDVKLLHKRRIFQVGWLKEFLWLKYDGETDVASCRICTEFCDLMPENVQSKKIRRCFTAPFKLETFKFHGKSAQHTKCAGTLSGQIATDERTPAALFVKRMDKDAFQRMTVVFNTAYYIAKNNKPFCDIRGLLKYARKLGVNVSEQYDNDKRCAEFVKYIAETIRDNVVAEVKENHYFSVLLDGSTTEQLMYLKYCTGGVLKEQFLGVVQLSTAAGEGYFNAVVAVLRKYGLHWSENEGLVGLGMDETASMLSAGDGLATKMKDDVKYLVSMQCLPHKLQFGVLKSTKNTPYLTKVDDVLVGLFKFYGNAPKRLYELQIVAKSLSSNIIKMQSMHQVQWVTSKVGALSGLLTDWKRCIDHMETIVETGESVEAYQCHNFIIQLKSYRFLLTVHFLVDFLMIFKTLSLNFQKENLLLSHAKQHRKNALNALTKLQQSMGEMEKLFADNTIAGNYSDIDTDEIERGNVDFQTDRKKLIETGIKALNDRFLDASNCEVSTACAVFDTGSWPSSVDLLTTYGDSEIQTLAHHFHLLLSNDSVEQVTDVVLNEWHDAKRLQLDGDIFKTIDARKERYPLISKLFAIIIVLPTSTSTYDNSSTNMTFKTKSRSLHVESMEHLLHITINGPSLENFEPDLAIDKWYFASRMRHTKGHASKK